MTATLVLTDTVFTQLCDVAQAPLESAGVLLVRPVRDTEGQIARLLALAFRPSPAAAYAQRAPDGMTLEPAAYMDALREAEATEAIALWVHTHPGSDTSPKPSTRDTAVDAELAPTFRARTNQDVYGTLIIGPDGADLTFTGQVIDGGTTPISRLWVVGDQLRLLHAADNLDGPLPALHDRHVRALGPDAMRVISDLRVGVVGAGGTGSAVAEQLVRLGVRRLVLIDPKALTDANVTRVYGSGSQDVGQPKVEVLEAHLREIADVVVTPRVGTISIRSVAALLNTVDLVMGCTDDEAGRARLSRFAYSHLTPVFDMGVRVEADGAGTLDGIFGRVTVVQPGTACLLCRGRVDMALAVAQEQPAAEREALAAEGYAPALPGVEPAVIAYTTAVAAAAVNEFLERLVGYGGQPRPSEVVLRIHDRSLSANTRRAAEGHYCNPSAAVALGDQEPMWGINWPG